jgi:arylsulfatase I/J
VRLSIDLFNRTLVKVLFLFFAAAQCFAIETRPNIVLIVADDLGWADASYHQGKIPTPNIDSYSLGGLRLERFYATRACTFTRVALMTGQHAAALGMHNTVIGWYHRHGLPVETETLPEVLSRAGYQTFAVGKWHLGNAKKEYWPTRRGFKRFYGHLNGRVDYFEHTIEGRHDWRIDEQAIWPTGYSTNLIAEKSQEWIKEYTQNAEPFFAYIAFNAPHSPFQAPEEYIAKTDPNLPEEKRIYNAMVMALDDGIGRIMSAVQTSGESHNTLVLFLSDNGGLKKYSEQSILRGEKGSFYDGGSRVLSFAVWDTKIEPGISNVVVRAVDVPTILARLAGADFRDPQALYGRPDPSLIGVDHFEPEGIPGPLLIDMGEDSAAAILGNLKLVYRNGSTELFDIEKDPSEMTNIEESFPKEKEQLLNFIHTIPKSKPLVKRRYFMGRDVSIDKILWKVPNVIGEKHTLRWQLGFLLLVLFSAGYIVTFYVVRRIKVRNNVVDENSSLSRREK